VIKKEMIAMLLAGGQGSRLGVLTQNRQYRLAANTELSIFRSATVSILALTQLAF
jgi:2-C-methyl-D-erythritol 4-phosphate cytidylyltransferase